jgi:phosphatidate phosphatase APP1
LAKRKLKENIIYSRFGKAQTKELSPGINSFYRWYHEFGGQRIKHVENETKLLATIKTQWINKDPIVNILVRTYFGTA